MKRIDLVLIGAGQRGGMAYGTFALEHPDEARFVAVAEPDPLRRERFGREHGIPSDRRFTSWEDLLACGQIADAALVCTCEHLHVAPTIAAMETGYHVLLEKAMAPTAEGCVALVRAAERTGRILEVAHVGRYIDFFQKLHGILKEGRLGDIVTVEHRENVAYWHMAHSFVRGNWRNSDLTGPMILTKCCHDLDILHWNLGQTCVRLSSVGSLRHFVPSRVGPDIPDRCVDNCPIERECQFSAIRTYLEADPFPGLVKESSSVQPEDREIPRSWPFSVLTTDLTYAGMRQAIEVGQFGRCVYRCDNNVVDHQVVTMEMDGGTSVVLVMHGHSHEEHRSMRYDGTRATLRGVFADGRSELIIHDHLTGRAEKVEHATMTTSGHGGGDHARMAAFVGVMRDDDAPRASARECLESHLLAFAAEEARLSGNVVDMAAFRALAEASTSGDAP